MLKRILFSIITGAAGLLLVYFIARLFNYQIQPSSLFGAFLVFMFVELTGNNAKEKSKNQDKSIKKTTT